MSKFKAGDIVKCTDDIGAEGYLSEGGIYKIARITDMGDVITNNDYGSWHPRRFEQVFPESSVKELTLDDAFDEPDSVHWTEALKYPDTKPIQPPKKSAEQLAIDVLYNTTGKLYTERDIISITTIVAQIKNLESDL